MIVASFVQRARTATKLLSVDGSFTTTMLSFLYTNWSAEAIEVPSENDAPAISWLKSEAYVTVSVSAVKQR